MTDDRSIERAARSWLEVGPTEAPERAVEAVLLQIETTRQERDWHVPWRLPKMTGPLRVASAAVIGVLVVGGALFALAPGGSGPGGAASPAVSPAPSPSPAASASPSAAPSASAVFPAWYTGDRDGAGILAAGSQATKSFVPSFTFTVPQGWVNNLDLPIAYALFEDTPDNEAEYALSGETANGIFMVSVESPYFFCAAWEESRGTAAERVAFLAASEALAVSEPIDVTIGGLTGKQIDVQLDPGWKDGCPGDPEAPDLRDVRNRVTYLDTPDRGVIAIAVGSRHSAGHEAFVAEAMPIIESFQFDLDP